MSASLKKCKSGWDRSLGTSKREQGIMTPKAPQNIGYRHNTRVVSMHHRVDGVPGLFELIHRLMVRDKIKMDSQALMRQRRRDVFKNR